jgi:hypothetical protein
MQPSQTQLFTCDACGHQFAASPAVIEKQPTCPKCKTFGKLRGPDGKMAGSKRQVVKVGGQGGQRPGPRPGTRPGGPPRPASGGDHGDVVEVSADVAYGTRGNPKALINGIITLVLGIGIVVTMYLIVTTLQSDHTETQRQLREEVLDVAEFEEAVDRSVNSVRGILNRVEGGTVRESTDFSAVMDAIVQAGGDRPSGTMPVRPGSPLRVHGFVIEAPDARTGKTVTGFVMLLYYKNAEEVNRANAEILNSFQGVAGYNFRVDATLWFAAYSGVNYGGEVSDALKRSLMLGAPSSFEQFRKRTGVLE